MARIDACASSPKNIDEVFWVSALDRGQVHYCSPADEKVIPVAGVHAVLDAGDPATPREHPEEPRPRRAATATTGRVPVEAAP